MRIPLLLMVVLLFLNGCGNRENNPREAARKAQDTCSDARSWSGLLQSENLSEVADEACSLANLLEAQANEVEAR